MKRNIVETLVGAIVLVVAGSFLVSAYKGANLTPTSDGYSLIAKFERADGINIGSDIRIGGVKVGVVTNQYLDNDSYKAVLELNINHKIKIPADSSAQILSDGLLGGKYLALIPGSEDEILKAKDEIKYTQSSVNIETLIGKMIFNQDKK